VDRQRQYEFFAQQYTAYLPRVLNYVRLRTDDEALAQDLTALTFERALTHLSTLRDRGAFGSWLFRIARNVIAGHYRRRRHELPIESIQDQAATIPSAESGIVHSEELDAMRDALLTLAEREQEIIRLRFVAGLTNRAIARTMGLREGNVAVILYRALRKMRAILETETESCNSARQREN
jgi:RNA polymerase sigma-70 factor (ECF subfamily)